MLSRVRCCAKQSSSQTLVKLSYAKAKGLTRTAHVFRVHSSKSETIEDFKDGSRLRFAQSDWPRGARSALMECNQHESTCVMTVTQSGTQVRSRAYAIRGCQQTLVVREKHTPENPSGLYGRWEEPPMPRLPGSQIEERFWERPPWQGSISSPNDSPFTVHAPGIRRWVLSFCSLWTRSRQRQTKELISRS
ncbi:hypothetical protein AUEXF2481DRAFT_206594 [Aureobasidium subglaciale EXF-2481]|uniref:Uncharacterized protein n=1 Tax=Aureobasidium subglaciale (strain EXF-2481) TaxID=1043005 RepID=A0A074Z0Q7_AURSE|nr:uncharacterized protein AUEXF2481DRAFT_206594 [Aureobasidium subglaciale EXF-2481]KEQ99957.1 hypothetical protein AUEXF2481DRAFT_206594 [Aureobasidium subglaciale EXF-2481]